MFIPGFGPAGTVPAEISNPAVIHTDKLDSECLLCWSYSPAYIQELGSISLETKECIANYKEKLVSALLGILTV